MNTKSWRRIKDNVYGKKVTERRDELEKDVESFVERFESFKLGKEERHNMASGYMIKLIEMKERVREFEYKWNDKDKTQPIMWEIGGPGGGHKKLCWYDLEELELMHYLKNSELEIRDRMHQMEHMDKMLNKLVERNGGTPPTREQFLKENENYWDTRLAQQALDDLLS